MTTRTAHRALAALSLSSGTDGILQSDGTIWSQAATLGTRTKGTEFSIDRDTIDSFVRNFTSGYPQKIPADYDHALTTDDPEIRKLRAQGQVPKAGDVLELRGVFGADEFTGELKTAAGQLAQRAGRSLDDPRNLGLWIRWKPTARALERIKAGEYSELSITFADDFPNNTDGTPQGPTLIAVALTNLPFLDDMLPVAASRTGGTATAPADNPHHQEKHMSKQLTMLSVAAALLASAPSSEEEALVQLNQLGPELKQLREFRSVLAEEIGGVTDPAKAVTSIRELRAKAEKADTLEAQVKEQTKTRIATEVETTIKQYEAGIGSKPLRDMFVRQLTGELEAGKKLEETETVATLKSLGQASNLGRQAPVDSGTQPDEDVLLDQKAKELMNSDPELKQLATTDRHTAYKRALSMAHTALHAAK